MFDELELDGIQLVTTPSFLLAMKNIDLVIEQRAITMFWGDTGLGKSFAADTVRNDVVGPEDCATISLTTSPNPAFIANELLEQVTGVEHELTRWKAARDIKRELKDRRMLVIIDEAQNLSLECIEWLRWLHEKLPGRFALLFVGGLGLAARLRTSRQLWRRLQAPTAFNELPDALVTELIRQWHPMYTDADSDVFDLMRKRCGGRLGDWKNISIIVQHELRERGLETATGEIAKIAIDRDRQGRTIAAAA